MALKSDMELSQPAWVIANARVANGGSRVAQWTLIVLFLGCIATIPLVQCIRELRQSERPRVLEIFTLRPTAANLRAYEKRLEKVSFVSDPFRSWVQEMQFSWLGDGGEKALRGVGDWLFYKPGIDASLQAAPMTAGRTEPPTDPLPALIAFRDDLAARGIHLLLMPAPNKESVYPDRVTRRLSGRTSLPTPSMVELLERLRQAEFEVVDLFQVYNQARQGRGDEAQNSHYLVQDSHWSPLGVELAAQTVANRLVELGWVSRGTTEYQSKPALVERLGDVLRMLQLPHLEKRAKPERVDCRQVISALNGEVYREVDGSSILVLGDSFLRIYEQDEPRGAGFVAHLAAQLNQPVQSLVSEGGASTLVRQELYRRPRLLEGKKVVVWEFVERDLRLGAEGWQVIRMAR